MGDYSSKAPGNRSDCRGVWARTADGTRAVTSKVLDLLFPPTCVFCFADTGESKASGLFCSKCRERLFPHFELACPRCGFPSPPGGRASSEEGCAHCGSRKFRFDLAVAIGVYGDGLQTALLRMKHQRGHRLAVAVGQEMACRLRDRLSALHLDFVVPVPAPWRRLLVRGADGPAILAGQIGRHLHLPVFPNMLKWRRKAQRQHTLLPAQRFQNVHKALAMSRGYDISGARALVVDDILTTGATANEAARVLCGAGAAGVIVCVAARVADR